MTLTCLSEHVAPSSWMSDSKVQLEAGCDGGWALASLLVESSSLLVQLVAGCARQCMHPPGLPVPAK